jgi:hypothetical protein
MNVEQALDSLEKTTGWLGGLIISGVLLTVSDTSTIKIGDVPFARAHAALIFFIAADIVFIHIFRRIMFVGDLIRNGDFASQERDILTLRYHSWALNPFFQSPKSPRYVLDSLPLIALIAAWWIGALCSLRLLRGQHQFSDAILFSVFLAYCLLGIYIGGRIHRIMSICLDKKLVWAKRGAVALACIALMCISFL